MYPGGAGDGIVVRVRFAEVDVRDCTNLRTLGTVSAALRHASQRQSVGCVEDIAGCPFWCCTLAGLEAENMLTR